MLTNNISTIIETNNSKYDIGKTVSKTTNTIITTAKRKSDNHPCIAKFILKTKKYQNIEREFYLVQYIHEHLSEIPISDEQNPGNCIIKYDDLIYIRKTLVLIMDDKREFGGGGDIKKEKICLDLFQYIPKNNQVENNQIQTQAQTTSQLSHSHLLSIYKQLLSCLAFLHSLDIAHGDLRLENILYQPSKNQITLIDFEFAKSPLFPDRYNQTIYGSPIYMVPNRNKYYYRTATISDYKSFDCWACSLLLYELAVQSEFQDDEPIHINFDLISDLKLKEFLQYAIVKDDTLRPTMQQMLDKLSSLFLC